MQSGLAIVPPGNWFVKNTYLVPFATKYMALEACCWWMIQTTATFCHQLLSCSTANVHQKRQVIRIQRTTTTLIEETLSVLGSTYSSPSTRKCCPMIRIMSWSVRLLILTWLMQLLSPFWCWATPFEWFMSEVVDRPFAPFSACVWLLPLVVCMLLAWSVNAEPAKSRLLVPIRPNNSGEEDDDEEEEVDETGPDFGATRCLFRGGGESPPSSESPLDARLASVWSFYDSSSPSR